MKQFWVYLMSNKSRRLYTGMTSALVSRVIEHKLKLYPNSFTARYCYDMLVWYEELQRFGARGRGNLRSKGLAKGKKVALILPENADWTDLSLEWQEDPGWKLEPDARPRLKRRKLDP